MGKFFKVASKFLNAEHVSATLTSLFIAKNQCVIYCSYYPINCVLIAIAIRSANVSWYTDQTHASLFYYFFKREYLIPGPA
jgi:hypothetical protein